MTTPLYTIGHSNHALEHFNKLLGLHDIHVLVDVRTKPYSKFCPHFSQDALRAGLLDAGIDYLFMGQALGGKPDDDSMYDEDGHPAYARMAKTPGFTCGIDQLIGEVGARRVAIMCSEENPSSCHRRFLIAPALLAREVTIIHIRGDGSLETEEELREQEHTSDDDQLSLFRETEAP